MPTRRHRIAFLVGLGCGVVAATAGSAHDDPGNKLVDFARSGAWEVWCLDVGGSGRIDCDLNIVVNYVPNPNFRGLIPRVYLADDDEPLWRIDYETQTSFGRGYVQVDDEPRFSLAACERPCIIDGAEAHRLTELLSTAARPPSTSTTIWSRRSTSPSIWTASPAVWRRCGICNRSTVPEAPAPQPCSPATGWTLRCVATSAKLHRYL